MEDGGSEIHICSQYGHKVSSIIKKSSIPIVGKNPNSQKGPSFISLGVLSPKGGETSNHYIILSQEQGDLEGENSQNLMVSVE